MSRAIGLPPIDLGDTSIAADDADLPGETEETTEQNPNAEIHTILQQHNAALSLLSDPDVQAVLQAKRQGRTLQVAAPAQQAAPAEPEEPADLEAMNNAQLAQHMTGQFEKVLDKIVGQHLAPLQERLVQLDQVASETVQDRTRREIETVQEKHPDFKDYGQDIMQLHDKHPTLTVKDLYLLAKSQKLASMPQEQSRPGTRSERPTATVRPKVPVVAQNPNLTGRAGMRAILADHFRRNPRA